MGTIQVSIDIEHRGDFKADSKDLRDKIKYAILDRTAKVNKFKILKIKLTEKE